MKNKTDNYPGRGHHGVCRDIQTACQTCQCHGAGYDKGFAAAFMAASGNVGIVIPSSIAFASVFAWLLTTSHIASAIAETVLSLTDNKILLLIMMNVIFLFAGCFCCLQYSRCALKGSFNQSDFSYHCKPDCPGSGDIYPGAVPVAA